MRATSRTASASPPRVGAASRSAVKVARCASNGTTTPASRVVANSATPAHGETNAIPTAVPVITSRPDATGISTLTTTSVTASVSETARVSRSPRWAPIRVVRASES